MEEEENYLHIITKVRESFNSPELSDILVRSKNTTFHCHKIILSSREGGWGLEKSLACTNILNWQDINDQTAARILRWIYLGKQIASELDSSEFLKDLLTAALKLKLTDIKTSVEELIREKDDVQLLVKSESQRQGMIKACNACPGCLREDCGICRMCQDMRKYGGDGKLKKRCKLRQCSAQIQTRNLRRINKESSTKVPPNFMVVERKNLFITKVVKVQPNPSRRIEEDLSENEEKIERDQELVQEVSILDEVGVSHLPDKVSHQVSTTCSNAETSVREDMSEGSVTGTQEEAEYQDKLLVSVTNAEHDYTSVSWVR